MKWVRQEIRVEDRDNLVLLALNGGSFFTATLAVWSLAASLKLAGDFAVSGGVLSHWMFWGLASLGFRELARRYARDFAGRHRHALAVRRPSEAAPRGRASAAATPTNRIAA
jgi:hypothetical protein